ncbi:hypothetical protein [Clostridium felsineum]|uniref:Uncharacterized protein n=1 Tax=Clostridium felsineum TaxID=36839 RepID=A0A1S8LD60_9CLOT|nr:hypothetical protein [Clostridium felsineum]URZ05876.1 hypothetical protein CLROS_012080 [Clostridium felsineum]URZ10913.1 hypothetical protein CROST_016290 [Clostridium felsineum]
MCEIYKNLFCYQGCGCCGYCDNKDSCETVCGIYKENKDKFDEMLAKNRR